MTSKYQKEWSDVLSKNIWSIETPGIPRTTPVSIGSHGSNESKNILKILKMKGTKKDKFYTHLTGVLKNIGFMRNFDPTPLIEYLNSLLSNRQSDAKRHTDSDIYENLRRLYQTIAPSKEVESANFNREDNRATKIQKFLDEARSPPVEVYLDYGCGECELTDAIGKSLKLKPENIHGVDIVDNRGPSAASLNFNLIDVKNNKIPFPDDHFDLITISMVLHHIPDPSLTTTISELHRVLKPTGLIVMREHNIQRNQNADMSIVLDFMHDIYSRVVTSNLTWKTTDKYYSNYRSMDEWDTLMKDAGIVTNYFKPMFNNNIKLNPVASCHRLYNKERKGATETQITQPTDEGKEKETLPIFRTLTDNIPRIKYQRRAKEIKDVLHWGQRKLLMSEIEFLTLFYQSDTYKAHPAKSIYMIYAGSAPGTHIKYLSKLFPKVYFILYDPREFDPILENRKHIKTNTQLFLDETAEEWISANHPKKHILLVSDIRTAEPEKMPREEVESRIRCDNEWQTNWWRIMKPAMAMFKFRLPWDDSVTEFPTGEIYLQIFPPPSSTETRLIVFSPDAPLRNYDNRAYEEQMFRFNTVERIRHYENILSDIPIGKKEGLDNRYDSASEIYVIKSFLDHFTGEPATAKSVIKISREISKALSSTRDLTSAQPLKKYAKEIVKTMKGLGEIPKDAPYDRNTYHKYVIANYDRLVQRGILDPLIDEGGVWFRETARETARENIFTSNPKP